MNDPVIAPQRQPSVLLIVSLCFNIALLALFAIFYLRGGMNTTELREGGRSISAQSLMHMVPAEEGKIRAILEAHHKRMRELRKAALRAREEAFGILQSKDFKAEDFAKSLNAVQAADAALEAETMQITAESVAALTPQERAAIAGETKRPDRAGLRRLFRKH